MLVDDNVANLKIGKNALADRYDVFTVPSAEKMLELLERNHPNLILLDINMPKMDGYQAIKLLKNNSATRDIPVIFLTGYDDEASELEGLSMGAIDYISKPFSPPLLRRRIENHLLMETQKTALQSYNTNLQGMVEEKTKMVYRLQSTILRTVAELVEWRDNFTGDHIERTQQCLGILITNMIEKGIYPQLTAGWDVNMLMQSSQLHDVGKIAIRDDILRKNGPLTSEEFNDMKNHVAFGIMIIDKIAGDKGDSDFLDFAKVFAGSHHEKWNGSGYPEGLKNEQIPLLGRLMALADVYDALTSERPYKKAMSHADAMEIILQGRATHFDPELTDLFLSVSDQLERIPSQRSDIDAVFIST
jgi:putative two-component system response regulator